MKFYKIKHIPTGLFYQPAKGKCSWDKTNLSKNGKVYHKKPTLKHIDQGYNIINKEAKDKYKNGSIHKPFIKSEWQIIEFTVIKTVIED